MSTTYHRTRRMILRDGQDARDRLELLVSEIHAQVIEEDFSSPDKGIVHETTWRIVPGVQMYSADDIGSISTCVAIFGEDESLTAHYAELIMQYLRPMEPEELLRDATTQTDGYRRARMVLRAGFGAPYEFDSRFYSLIQDAMFDPSTLVRAAALHATRYSFWSQYIDPLKRVAIEDPDPLVRAEARNIVETASGSGEGNPGDGEPGISNED